MTCAEQLELTSENCRRVEEDTLPLLGKYSLIFFDGSSFGLLPAIYNHVISIIGHVISVIDHVINTVPVLLPLSTSDNALFLFLTFPLLPVNCEK